MSVLADWQIKQEIGIKPFAENEKREGKISYGVSSYGYDVRLGYTFKIPTARSVDVIDPKKSNDIHFDTWTMKENESLDIPAHSFVLGESLETFSIPRSVLCIVTGKSTYARCGVYVNVTPGEPEWEGKWTIELSNTTPKSVRIYPGEGIMQCIFLRTDGIGEQVFNLLKSHYPASLDRHKGTCRISYADKKGKYSNQLGLTLPKVD